MYVLNDWGLYIVYLVLFMIAFFSYEKIRSLKPIASLNVPKQARELIFGLTIGLITLLTQVINEEFLSGFQIPLFVSTVLFVMMFSNYISALYSFLPSITYWTLTKDIDSEFYVLIGTMFSLMLIYQVLDFVLKNKFVTWILCGISLFAALITFFIAGPAYDMGFTDNAFEKVSLVFILIPFGYAVTFWIFRFTISSRLLYESANFVYSRFYRAGLATNAIANFITKNKTDKAVFGIFELKYQMPDTEMRKREVIKTTLQHISDTFPEEAVLFDATMGRYGFFLPIKTKVNIRESLIGNYARARKRIDCLSQVEHILSRCQVKLMPTWKEEIDISIKSGVAIYGVQSNSIKKLMEYSTYALHTVNKFSLINLFFPKKLYKRKKDNILLSQMDSKVQLDNFDLKEVLLKSLKEKGQDLLYLDVENISEFTYIETIDEMIYSLNWKNIFNRYFGSSAVEEFSKRKNKIMFDYTPTILEDDFDIHEFERNLDAHDFKASGLILYFKHRGISLIKDKELVYKNIGKLKLRNIAIAIEVEDGKKIDPELKEYANYFVIKDHVLTSKIELKEDQEIIYLKKDDISTDESIIESGISYRILS